MNAKPPSASYTEHVQILTQASLNGFGWLFGGKLMEWIDVVAAVVARRHSNRNVTTVAVDNLHFSGPARANDAVLLTGKITFVGTTSMEVCVRTYVEALSGARREINTAYLVMVALDERECPTPVPKLIPETDEERQAWLAGERRNSLRKARRKEQY
jgi:acyl-CoA hydrolase